MQRLMLLDYAFNFKMLANVLNAETSPSVETVLSHLRLNNVNVTPSDRLDDGGCQLAII